MHTILIPEKSGYIKVKYGDFAISEGKAEIFAKIRVHAEPEYSHGGTD